jgi:hypothetical protein
LAAEAGPDEVALPDVELVCVDDEHATLTHKTARAATEAKENRIKNLSVKTIVKISDRATAAHAL